MPLPTIALPYYPLTLPTTKQQIRFRPFRVGEEKLLLMALESGEDAEMLKAMKRIVEDCVEATPPLDAENMPLFEIEYLFLNIRAKSVKEISEVTVACSKCKHPNRVAIKLDAIQVAFPENVSNVVRFGEKTKNSITFAYPSIKTTEGLEGEDDEKLLRFIVRCISSMIIDGNSYTHADATEDEFLEFLESLTAKQMQDIMDFFKHLPSISEDVCFKCVGKDCGEENKYRIASVRDFFQSPFPTST